MAVLPLDVDDDEPEGGAVVFVVDVPMIDEVVFSVAVAVVAALALSKSPPPNTMEAFFSCIDLRLFLFLFMSDGVLGVNAVLLRRRRAASSCSCLDALCCCCDFWGWIPPFLLLPRPRRRCEGVIGAEVAAEAPPPFW